MLLYSRLVMGSACSSETSIAIQNPEDGAVCHPERSVSVHINPVDEDRVFLWNINILLTSTLKLQAVRYPPNITHHKTTIWRIIVVKHQNLFSLFSYYFIKLTDKVNFPNIHTKRTEIIDLVFLFNVRQTVFWLWITWRKDLLDHCQG